MSIKIHFVFSFFIHSLILTYFLSFPVFKGGIDTLSFKELFVYLYSEEGRGAERPSATGRKVDSHVLGNEKGDHEADLPAQQIDNEKADQEEVFSKEQVVEIIRSGAIEQKVFKAGDASREVNVKAEHPEDEQHKIGVIDDASLHAQKAPEDAGEPSREEVIVYEGTVLKTMPGLTVIPYEEASKIETLYAQAEEAKETKDRHDTEVLAKQEDIKEEVEVKVEVQEHIETKEKVQVEVEAEIEEKIETAKHIDEKTGTETQTEKHIKDAVETDVTTVGKLHEEMEPTVPAEVYAGLLLETMPGTMTTMTIPFKDESPVDEVKEKAEVKAKVEEQQQIQEEAEVKIEVEEQQQIQEESEVEEQIETAKLMDEQEQESYEGEREPVLEPFEFEGAFDRSRVEEKLKYLESSLKEKNKKIKGREVVPEEPAHETITEKIFVPDEKQGEPEKPVTEIASSSLDQPYPENDRVKIEKDTDLKKQEDADTQSAEEISIKEIVTPDISEIKTGLLLASVPGETAVPFEEYLKRALPEERTGDRKEPQEKAYEEKKAGLLDRKQPSNTVQLKTDEVIDRERNLSEAEEKPFSGIFLPDAFFRKDIRIEITINDTETDGVSFQLIKKGHPLDEKKDSKRRKEIELVEDILIDYTEGYKRVVSTEKAENGIYIFSIKNNGAKGYEADILFNILEGKSGERRKEYKTVGLPPDTTLKYMFIIPEAVFWDDDAYFTGTIESSNTLTKFNEKTGLIWKEEKDR